MSAIVLRVALLVLLVLAWTVVLGCWSPR